ncbi:MAG: dihydroneopterin aldolase [Zhongshania sp.]|uniref:7,8-dihydroneopterin aldolase n=1 Tax=Zhongshania guokunii TaxID=641783 RepID=A0ABV3U551_9GAMM|nr:dihydroneopterin aldolase [Zhongshania sp.]MDF1691305.1 dihydroneopterin aldolase [Zhongshania sp.]
MDIVYIRELSVDTVIGIFDWERAHRQTVVMNLELGTDIRAAAATDDISKTLNYKAVTEAVFAFVRSSEFLLIETLAERCAALIMTEFEVPWLRLSIAKPGAMRQANEVGVVIERGTPLVIGAAVDASDK